MPKSIKQKMNADERQLRMHVEQLRHLQHMLSILGEASTNRDVVEISEELSAGISNLIRDSWMDDTSQAQFFSQAPDMVEDD
jgi:hypothetical protein